MKPHQQAGFRKKLMFFTLSEALRPRESVKNTVFCSCIERKPCPKPSLDGDQYSLTVKQVSILRLSSRQKRRKAQCFPVFAQNWAQVGAHARGGVAPRAELCFLNLPAHYGLIHMGERKSAAQGGIFVGRDKGRGKPLPRVGGIYTQPGGAAGFTLLTHHRPRRQPQLTAICSKHGATCARHVCGRKQAHKRVAKSIY